VRPDREATFAAEANVIAGNVCLYGATSGEAFIRGVVGERFGVRNSGATAVVEGVGDHACEYMTGGRVIIIGPTGRNLAAGMSGGIAYVIDLPEVRVNGEMVDLDELDTGDRAFLYGVIKRHVENTDSSVGQALLDDWEASAARFTKVMPRDYKRVLEASAIADAEGRDVATAIMEAAHG